MLRGTVLYPEAGPLEKANLLWHGSGESRRALGHRQAGPGPPLIACWELRSSTDISSGDATGQNEQEAYVTGPVHFARRLDWTGMQNVACTVCMHACHDRGNHDDAMHGHDVSMDGRMGGRMDGRMAGRLDSGVVHTDLMTDG